MNPQTSSDIKLASPAAQQTTSNLTPSTTAPTPLPASSTMYQTSIQEAFTATPAGKTQSDRDSDKTSLSHTKVLLDIFHFIAFVLVFALVETTTTFDFIVKQLIYLLLIFYLFSRMLDNKDMYGYYHCMYAIIITVAPFLLTNKHLLFIHLIIILTALATRKIYRGCMIRKLDKHTKISHNSWTKMVNWDVLLPILGGVSGLKLYLR